VATFHEIDELKILYRFNEVDVAHLFAGEHAPHRFPYMGIQVYRVENLRLRMSFGNLPESGADVFKADTEVFAAMTGDENQLFPFVKKGEFGLQSVCQVGNALDTEGDCQERIDHRIAGDEDGVRGFPFPQQVLAGTFGGGKMQVGQDAGNPSVDLLGKW
jgi:hypothetical protein